jgi:hypothetical protein
MADRREENVRVGVFEGRGQVLGHDLVVIEKGARKRTRSGKPCPLLPVALRQPAPGALEIACLPRFGATTEQQQHAGADTDSQGPMDHPKERLADQG